MYTIVTATVKERLLEGAVRVLGEKGFAATTAREVAAASGCNLRSIGYHYGSVRGLALAALSQNFRRWMAPLIDERAGSVRDGLELFVRELPQNAALVRAWLEAVAAAQDDDELRETLATNQRWFTAALADRLSTAGVADPFAAAAALVTVCDGAMVRFLLHRETPPVEDLLAQAAPAFSALRAPGPGSP